MYLWLSIGAIENETQTEVNMIVIRYYKADMCSFFSDVKVVRQDQNIHREKVLYQVR